MLRFFLAKLRETPGPLKEARLIVSDLAEEVLDITEHYLKRALNRDESARGETWQPAATAQEEMPIPNTPKETPARTKKKKAERPRPARILDVPSDLAAALDVSANQRKQEFKVLAILWDAKNRNLGDLSAKELSEHGEKLGVAIRHENVRKIIRMRLENYVKTIQNRAEGISIYHYHITSSGEQYFVNKYLK